MFDQNLKTRVQDCLVCSSDRKGESVEWKVLWFSFRKGFSMVQDAATEPECERLFSELINEFLPDVPVTNGREGKPSKVQRAREYIMEYVWSRREQWASCYFEGLFIFGATTTQQSDSWNSCMKAVSSYSNMRDMLRIVLFL